MKLYLLLTIVSVVLGGWAHATTDVLLFVADTPAAKTRAYDVKSLLENDLPPYNQLDLEVAVHALSPQEMDCRDEYPESRLLTCGERTNAIATRLKKQYRARFVLIITHHLDWQGSGGRPFPVAAAGLSSLMAIHELMHIMGFKDEYVEDGSFVEARPNAEGFITIMAADTSCIPKTYWGKIARSLGRSPEELDFHAPTRCE